MAVQASSRARQGGTVAAHRCVTQLQPGQSAVDVGRSPRTCGGAIVIQAALIKIDKPGGQDGASPLGLVVLEANFPPHRVPAKDRMESPTFKAGAVLIHGGFPHGYQAGVEDPTAVEASFVAPDVDPRERGLGAEGDCQAPSGLVRDVPVDHGATGTHFESARVVDHDPAAHVGAVLAHLRTQENERTVAEDPAAARATHNSVGEHASVVGDDATVHGERAPVADPGADLLLPAADQHGVQIDRGGVEDLEDAVDAVGVDERGTFPDNGDIIGEIQVAGGCGVFQGASDGKIVNPRRKADGLRSRADVGIDDRLPQRAVPVAHPIVGVVELGDDVFGDTTVGWRTTLDGEGKEQDEKECEERRKVFGVHGASLPL